MRRLPRPAGRPGFLRVSAGHGDRRFVGGAAVMGRQLDDVIQAMKRPNITVQVLPLRTHAHVGLEGAFSVLTLGVSDPDVGYIEGPAGDGYVEAADQVRKLKVTFERLASATVRDGVDVHVTKAGTVWIATVDGVAGGISAHSVKELHNDVAVGLPFLFADYDRPPTPIYHYTLPGLSKEDLSAFAELQHRAVAITEDYGRTAKTRVEQLHGLGLPQS
ncbi:Scr1 family TA system antitoxin-like transcriptional regulator [Sphaerimonospora cavernae]|uniref:Scr1 family TA system antitoxin-like transcriptional regulator n=1 Tax=Sphaerimonospora cavernae TaxID=1740611 RepID=A0ABV6U3M6_9ACTN